MCRRVLKILVAARVVAMLRGLELRIQITNLHRDGPIVNHLIEGVKLLWKTSKDVRDEFTSGKQGFSPGSFGASVPVAQPGLTNRD
jgi:hypothetical protein